MKKPTGQLLEEAAFAWLHRASVEQAHLPAFFSRLLGERTHQRGFANARDPMDVKHAWSRRHRALVQQLQLLLSSDDRTSRLSRVHNPVLSTNREFPSALPVKLEILKLRRRASESADSMYQNARAERGNRGGANCYVDRHLCHRL